MVATAIGERLKEGPRTLNELRDWWVDERKGDAGEFKQALRYLLEHELVEARNLGGSGTKMVALPGQHHRSKGSPFVPASSAAASPPPVPPPASPRPSTPAPSASPSGGATLNVQSSGDDVPSPPAAAAATTVEPPSSAAPPAAGAPAAKALLTTAEVAARAGFHVRHVPGAILDYQKATGAKVRFEVMPGKGRPRAYWREDIEAYEAWRATRPNVAGAAKRHGRPTPAAQDAAAVASDVARSNAHRQAIDEALPAGPPGPSDVPPPPVRPEWKPPRVELGVLHLTLSPAAQAQLARMLKTGLYGGSIREIAEQLVMAGLRRAARFVSMRERGRR